MNESLEEYIERVIVRNNETFDDGHLIEFNYEDSDIKENKEYFKGCYEYGLSPYKALTFFWDELNEEL